MQEIVLNGKPLSAWHCKMKDDWAEQRDQYSGNYLQPSQAQRIIPINSELPIKTISFTLDYLGVGREIYRGKLELLMLSGTFELVLPDRPAFTMWMTRLGAEKHSRNSTEVQYSFVGYQHGTRKKMTSANYSLTVRCESSVLKTPTKIILHNYPFMNTEMLVYNGAIFSVSQDYIDYLTSHGETSASSHTVLIDGENQKFEVDDANVLSAVACADFPHFAPGNNVIECPATQNYDVEYTPVYL
ncbi:MAG: hypothetical protein E7572_05920 [Ruminococcaceae bacterium]|nr:hypothetical protein [Oscillospiraceae bacterium]